MYIACKSYLNRWLQIHFIMHPFDNMMLWLQSLVCHRKLNRSLARQRYDNFAYRAQIISTSVPLIANIFRIYSKIRIFLGVLMGHWAIGNMVKNLVINTPDYCRSCQDEEEAETIKHLIWDCPNLHNRRLLHMENRLFVELSKLAQASLMDLSRTQAGLSRN